MITRCFACISLDRWVVYMVSEKKHDEVETTSDPLSLSVIEQAVFVMQCFGKGITARQLTEALENETSLSQAYMLFFKQMDWIQGDVAGEWCLSEKGRKVLKHLQGGELATQTQQ